jgi:hypothetical protein
MSKCNAVTKRAVVTKAYNNILVKIYYVLCLVCKKRCFVNFVKAMVDPKCTVLESP